MARPITLPTRVVLPSGAAMLRAGDAYRRMGISRATAHVWRRHGFPSSDRRNLIDTAALASWLVARGVSLQWI